MMIDYELDEEEREILEASERGEGHSVPDLERRLEEARQIARNTLKDYTRLSLWLSPRHVEIACAVAEKRETAYQTFVINLVRKYLYGMLIENERHPTLAAAYARPLVGESGGNGSQGPDDEKLEDYTEVSFRLSPCEMKSARALAEERGTSYETLVSNVVGMYLDGMLMDRKQSQAVAAKEQPQPVAAGASPASHRRTR